MRMNNAGEFHFCILNVLMSGLIRKPEATGDVAEWSNSLGQNKIEKQMPSLSLPPSPPPPNQKRPKHAIFPSLVWRGGVTGVRVNFQYSFVQYWRQPQSCLHCNVNDQTWTEALTGIGKKCLFKNRRSGMQCQESAWSSFPSSIFTPPYWGGKQVNPNSIPRGTSFSSRKEHSEMSDNDKAYYFNNGALTFTFAYLSLFGLSAE